MAQNSTHWPINQPSQLVAALLLDLSLTLSSLMLMAHLSHSSPPSASVSTLRSLRLGFCSLWFVVRLQSLSLQGLFFLILWSLILIMWLGWGNARHALHRKWLRVFSHASRWLSCPLPCNKNLICRYQWRSMERNIEDLSLVWILHHFQTLGCYWCPHSLPSSL